MLTANKGKSIATEKGELDIKGIGIGTLNVKDFTKTLVSWSDLADLGITGTLGKTEIKLFTPDGKPWTTVTRGADRLWHFTEAEEHYN